MARNSVRQAVKNATASKAPAKEAPKGRVLEDKKAKPEFEPADFVGMTCLVTAGKKNKGETVDVYHVGKPNHFGRIYAMAESSDGKTYLDIKYLEIKGAFDKKRLAKLQKEHEEITTATVYVPARLVSQSEKAICIHRNGWYGPVWFPKVMISTTEAFVGEDLVYEVTAWKIKKEIGPDAFEKLEEMQAELTALVEA